jgi:hypothetical protein
LLKELALFTEMQHSMSEKHLVFELRHSLEGGNPVYLLAAPLAAR